MFNQPYHPRPWHFFLPTGFYLGGFWLVQKLGNGMDVLALASWIWFNGAILNVWMAGAGLLAWLVELERAKDYQLPAPTEEPKPRKLIDLSYKDNKWQNVSVNIKQRDLRWQQFGVAVINGQPMTQSKWTGKGRPFSRPEFEKQIKKWAADLVIVHEKVKGRASSYKPNGAEGWRYFKALADGRATLPLPSKES